MTAPNPDASRADRLLDEVLATPAPEPDACECGDPFCIFAEPAEEAS
ncbi:hypothetical protein [Streptomyces sp. NPDC020983]